MDTLPPLSMSRVHRMDRTIARIPLSEGICAVACTDVHRTTTDQHGHAPSEVHKTARREAVLDEAQIAKLLSGEKDAEGRALFLFPTAALPLIGKHRHTDIENVRHQGPAALQAADPYRHRGGGSTHQTMLLHSVHEAARTPFTVLEKAGPAGYTVLETTGVSYLDAQGRLVPSLFEAGYVDGGFDNGRYDLEKAAAHLLTRDDVELIPSRLGGTLERLAQNPQEAIHTIPSYNAREHRDRSLVFLWSPEGDTRARIVDWTAGKHDAYSMEFWWFVFEEDLLGLRACGAALFDNPYDTRDG